MNPIDLRYLQVQCNALRHNEARGVTRLFEGQQFRIAMPHRWLSNVCPESRPDDVMPTATVTAQYTPDGWRFLYNGPVLV